MKTGEIINIIMSAVTLIGVLFAIWFRVKEPQENLEKKQAINDEKDKNKAEKGSFEVLKAQFEIYIENTEKKFCELSGRIDKNLTLNQNHIHTLDTKIDKVNENMVIVGNNITELKTIINERIPKKQL